ncbi:MAG: monooxygenase [Myxococcales bacterium]|nr:monooxygenase [Myxococcales bacterium]
MSKALRFFVALVLVVGCSSDPVNPAADGKVPGDGGVLPEFGSGDDGPVDAPETPSNLTYWEHAKPIIDAKCTGCHRTGGIGPFPLTSYAAVKAVTPIARGAIFDRYMPPWHAAKGCSDYQHDASLTDLQRQTLLDWIDAGAPEGDPKNEGAPLDGPPTLKSVDVTLTMKAAYTQQLKPDEYRCFIIDWPYQTTKYITGFNVKPGNGGVVHHMIAYLATKKSDIDKITAKDGSDGHEGYKCFGTPGFGDVLSTPWLGAWAPGTGAVNFPAGTGLEIPPGAKVVLQMHYNADSSGGGSDQSSIEFSVADTATKARLQPLTNPLWLSGNAMPIPKDQDNVKHEFTIDPTILTGGKAITFYNVMAHMHYLGKGFQLKINHKDGSESCMLDIKRWDFNWQRFYQFAQPKKLASGDTLTIRCLWDNTAANQPVINGQKAASQDVNWGEGTRDEMCLAVAYILDPF